MTQTVRDVMTTDPVTIEAESTIEELARAMRENDTGAIIVLDHGRVTGIATDRDIAVRAIADGKGPETPVAEVCTADVETVTPDAELDDVIDLMRSWAVRRVPVVEADRAVGIVSLGDLALEGEGESPLADISAAPSNN